LNVPVRCVFSIFGKWQILDFLSITWSAGASDVQESRIDSCGGPARVAPIDSGAAPHFGVGHAALHLRRRRARLDA
jgi:hypothetical protein